jgi:hypothetical protein
MASSNGIIDVLQAELSKRLEKVYYKTGKECDGKESQIGTFAKSDGSVKKRLSFQVIARALFKRAMYVQQVTPLDSFGVLVYTPVSATSIEQYGTVVSAELALHKMELFKGATTTHTGNACGTTMGRLNSASGDWGFANSVELMERIPVPRIKSESFKNANLHTVTSAFLNDE